MADEIGIKLTLNGQQVKDEVIDLSKTIDKEFTKTEKSIQDNDKALKSVVNTVVNVSNNYDKLASSVKNGFSSLQKANAELARGTATGRNQLDTLRKLDGTNKILNKSRRDSINLIRVNAKTNKILESSLEQINETLSKQTRVTNNNTKAKKKNVAVNKKAAKGFVSISDSINLVNIGLAGTIYASFRAAEGIISIKDEYKLLGSQINLVLDESSNLLDVQNQLLVTANKTRQEFSATVTLYARLDRATRQLALSDKEVIKLTETLNKAIIISGASAQESSAAIIQLSQGLASGALRGDELRSVLEQVPRVAQLIADGLGTTVGKLRELGTAGELTTSKIVGAIESQASSINEEFKKVEETTGQIWVGLTNNASAYLDKVESVNKAQGVFNSILKTISKDFEALNEKKALEVAKNTGALSRTLSQQKLIIEDLRVKSNKYFDDFSKRGISQYSILSKAYIVQRDLLPLIEARVEKEEAEAKIIKEKAAEEQKALSLAKKNAKEKIKTDKADAKEALAIAKDAEKREIESIDLVTKLDAESRILRLTGKERELAQLDAEIEKLKTSAELKIEDERILQETMTDILEIESSKRQDINDKYYEAEKKKTDLRVKQEAKASEQILSNSLAASKTLFGENKLAASAIATVEGIVAVQKALASAPYPYNLALAASVGVVAASNVAQINGVGYADGTEFVTGSGGPRDDRVNVNLSPSERVLSSQQNSQLNGISNEELVDRAIGGGSDVLQGAGLINSLFSREEISQRVIDVYGFGIDKGFVPQG